MRLKVPMALGCWLTFLALAGFIGAIIWLVVTADSGRPSPTMQTTVMMQRLRAVGIPAIGKDAHDRFFIIIERFEDSDELVTDTLDRFGGRIIMSTQELAEMLVDVAAWDDPVGVGILSRELVEQRFELILPQIPSVPNAWSPPR